MEDGSRKAIKAAFFANLGISVAKFTGFLLTGAASMLAESVHSAADTSNQALLLLGGSRARKVEFDGVDGAGIPAAIDAIEASVRAAVPSARVI